MPRICSHQQGPFQVGQGAVAPPVQQRLQQAGKGEIPGRMIGIMTIAPGLQKGIGRIHGQEQGHQDDLRQQDIIGIAPGPPVQVMADETPELQDIPAAKEQYANSKYAYSEKFKGIDQERVESAEGGGEEAMRPEDPVQHDLQHFQVDDDKTCVDDEMHQSHQRVPEHFLLAESQQQHIPPAQAPMIIIRFVFAQEDVPADLTGLFTKPPNSHTGCQDEEDLLKEAHARNYFEC